MSADYRRMAWQARANRIATWARWIAIIAMAPEAYEAIRYHFPAWDDVAMPLTFVIHQVGGFVQRHTEMYRVDY